MDDEIKAARRKCVVEIADFIRKDPRYPEETAYSDVSLDLTNVWSCECGSEEFHLWCSGHIQCTECDAELGGIRIIQEKEE